MYIKTYNKVDDKVKNSNKKVVKMTHGSQIPIKPINITPLPKKSQKIRTQQIDEKIINVYKSDDNLFGTKGQLYRFVSGKRTILGYLLLNIKNDNMYLSELFCFNKNENIENLLIETAKELFEESDCKTLSLVVNQDVVLQYKRLGFKILDQKNVCGTQVDEQIKNKTFDSGNILMYLSPEATESKFKNQNIIDFEKIKDNQNIVGALGGFVIYRKVYKHNLEEYGIISEDKIVGKIYLNFYKKDNGVYKNFFGKVTDRSPLYKYNNENGINKVFVEFWSVNGMKKYDNVGLLYILFEIAIEIGKYNDCIGLQTYVNYENALDLYKYGFRTQTINEAKSSEQLENILNMAEYTRTLNINSLGMIDMMLMKKVLI